MLLFITCAYPKNIFHFNNMYVPTASFMKFTFADDKISSNDSILCRLCSNLDNDNKFNIIHESSF